MRCHRRDANYSHAPHLLRRNGMFENKGEVGSQALVKVLDNLVDLFWVGRSCRTFSRVEKKRTYLTDQTLVLVSQTSFKGQVKGKTVSDSPGFYYVEEKDFF